MTWSSNAEVRRCRPLLGTFVEVTAWGLEQGELQTAVNSAFRAIEKVQELLSVHDPKSELSRLNREALFRPFPVSRETFAILRRAHRLAGESDGAFDPTVAPILARWGLLPPALRRSRPGNWRHVLLLESRLVQFVKPVALDLGGIAKGFAVDMAIRALKRNGAKRAVVNAGGDLRIFGEKPATVHLRHPAQPQWLVNTMQLRNSALATSSSYFTERMWRGNVVSHLVNPKTCRSIAGPMSVSVRAGECWLADALTKVVLAGPKRAASLLAKYQAEAFVLCV